MAQRRGSHSRLQSNATANTTAHTYNYSKSRHHPSSHRGVLSFLPQSASVWSAGTRTRTVPREVPATASMRLNAGDRLFDVKSQVTRGPERRWKLIPKCSALIQNAPATAMLAIGIRVCSFFDLLNALLMHLHSCRPPHQSSAHSRTLTIKEGPPSRFAPLRGPV